jgi:hypothetical protein
VETIRQGLRNQGFSAAVSDRIARRARRDSTMAIYNTKWNKFSEWCRNIQEDPVQATPQLVASFLEYLFDDLQLAPSTITNRVQIYYQPNT